MTSLIITKYFFKDNEICLVLHLLFEAWAGEDI